MLKGVADQASDRKLRLFAVACARHIWPRITDPRSRGAVEVAERFADGGATRVELTAAAAEAGGWPWVYAEDRVATTVAHLAWYTTRAVAWNAARDTARTVTEFAAYAAGVARGDADAEARRNVAALVRDIFGDPFQPVPPLALEVLSWNGGTVVRLAQAMYDARDFTNMGLLADALLDAGCADEGLLAHCRAAVSHARGCWAVDAVLGRS
jgi:hypothetical protein